MKKLLSLSVLILLLSTVYSQNSYYVDGTNGNDTNNGTSLATAWKNIQKACNSATANSIVYIRAGTYHENLVVNVNGTSGNPITFRNYMNDVVIIDGTGTTGSTMLTITNKSYLIFSGLTIQKLTKNNAVGIIVECTATGSVSSLAFKKLKIKNINWTNNASILPGASNNSQPFIAYGRGTSSTNAIKNLVVDSCEMSENITGFSETLSLDGNIDGFTISNNVVHHNVNIGIYVGGNYGECTVPSLDHVRNGVIEKNICYKNVSNYATSGGIYADGSLNVVIQRNISYGNGYGIELGCEENGTTENITVIDNVIYHNQDCGIAVGGYDTGTTGQVLNCMIRNNSLFENDSLENGSGELYLTKASNCTFMNNIMVTNSQEVLFSLENISPQASNVFNYNCWYTPSNNPNNITINWRATTYTKLATYKSGTSQDANSLFIDPGFTKASIPNPDLHLQNGSQCINAGNPATSILTGETDFDGNLRTIGDIDMGAYEKNITARNQENLSFGFIVYPNPAKEYLIIATPQTKDESFVTIVDLHGKELLKKQISGNVTKLNIQGFTSGVYVVKLICGKMVEVKKIVKR